MRYGYLKPKWSVRATCQKRAIAPCETPNRPFHAISMSYPRLIFPIDRFDYWNVSLVTKLIEIWLFAGKWSVRETCQKRAIAPCKTPNRPFHAISMSYPRLIFPIDAFWLLKCFISHKTRWDMAIRRQNGVCAQHAKNALLHLAKRPIDRFTPFQCHILVWYFQ